MPTSPEAKAASGSRDTRPRDGAAEAVNANGIFSPLRQATFRNMWLSNTVSSTGSLIQSVAAAWTMAAISTADHVALVQTASYLPVALLAIPAGAIPARRRAQFIHRIGRPGAG